MPAYRHFFVESISRYYPAGRERVISETEDNYGEISKGTRFAATSRNPVDRRLDFCAYFLALIKTLDKRGESYDHIREVCLEIVLEYVKPRNKLHALAKRIPAMLVGSWIARPILRMFGRKISHNKSKEGFIANLITDKDETYGLGYGIDIIECGICKLFAKHNFSKYAPPLCEVDEVTSQLAGLRLIRSGTIANGAEKCDFRFKRL
jgi:hypothetical protein